MHVKELILKPHAYTRYCERVGPIEYDELHSRCLEALAVPCRREREYINLKGAWWRYEQHETVVTLHTCYGESHFDLIAAITWAKKHNDKVRLQRWR